MRISPAFSTKAQERWREKFVRGVGMFVLAQNNQSREVDVFYLPIDFAPLQEGDAVPDIVAGPGWMIRHIFSDDAQQVLDSLHSIMGMAAGGGVLFEQVVLNIVEGGRKLQ